MKRTKVVSKKPSRDKVASSREPRRIRSIGVGFRVIDALERADGPLPLKTIAAASNMMASKAYLYLVTFEREGLVRQDPQTGYYGFGPSIIRLGLAAIRQIDVVRLARELLEQLREQTRCAAYVSIWGGRGPVIASKIDGDRQGSMGVRIGFVLPLLHSSTGRIFHAFLPNDETKLLVSEELNDADVRSRFGAPLREKPSQLANEVRVIGYATSENQINIGFASISVPVFDYSKQLVCALTVLGPASIVMQKRAEVVGHLLKSAEQLSAQLGEVRKPASKL